MHRKLFTIVSLIVLCMAGAMTVNAREADHQSTVVTAEGFQQTGHLSDGSRDTYVSTAEGGNITVSRSDGISAVYIEFDRIPTAWTLTDPVSGASVACGENAFLHEYVDVAELFQGSPESLVMSFEAGTAVADVYAFGEGELPQWVQVWDPPCEEADLLLFSSHSDDEQLFFSGILPYYAGELDMNVQVAYVVQHFQAYNTLNHKRPHEQLDGLWTVGVRNYPVMSDFPDLYAESKDRATAFAQATAVYETVGITYDDFVSYITGCLRRFEPFVVVTHDLDGEYGHGTHVVTARALTEAIGYAADESRYPESAAQYGTWEIEKAYLHLYEENPIVMNFDIPLESFGGKTAFEVSRDGFACHKSQHWTWFYRWMYGTEASPVKRATDITSYSPCNYGLYYTRVGYDVEGGDFFENVETYEERALAAAKAAEEARLEAERLKAEEEARAKAEAEAQAKAEAEAKAREEQQKKQEEEARQAAALAKAAQRTKVITIVLAGVVFVVIGVVIRVVTVTAGRRRRRRRRGH